MTAREFRAVESVALGLGNDLLCSVLEVSRERESASPHRRLSDAEIATFAFAVFALRLMREYEGKNIGDALGRVHSALAGIMIGRGYGPARGMLAIGEAIATFEHKSDGFLPAAVYCVHRMLQVPMCTEAGSCPIVGVCRMVDCIVEVRLEDTRLR